MTLQEWPRTTWANAGYETSQELSGPCWHREQLALPHGRAQLFLGFAYAGRTKPCPRRPYTLYTAHVFLGQTVIYVTVPGDTSAGAVTSPYVTRAGLVALVRALRPHVPGHGPLATPTPTYAPPPVPTGQPTGMTVADVYRRVQQAISRPGLLYHATIHFTARLGQGRKIVTQVGPPLRQWVDARHDVAREEQTGRATLLTAQRNYLRDGTINQPDGQVEIRGPSTCDGATVATSAVLGVTFIGCPEPGTVVQRGRYAGRPAIVLVRGTATGTRLLYLDARTFLPLAGESTGLFSEVTPPQPLQERVDFTHAFIPVHAVPAHFLDPAAFNPEAPLNRAPRGFTIDWLGAHFAGRRHLPPLVLSKVEVMQPGHEFILFYPSADAVSGPALVTLVERPRATWNSMSRPYGPCWARQDITLPHGRASIFMGFESMPGAKPCPTRPYDRFIAHVFLGQTVIVVDAPGAMMMRGHTRSLVESPYNTRKGIEMVVRALQPRVPTHGATGSNR